MIKDKKQVQAMLNKYLTDEEGIKALGFIKYHTFDKKLIASDSEAINKFFMENFGLDYFSIKYEELLEDMEGTKWLVINDIYDLVLLDKLIAFGIASNVFKENFIFRDEITKLEREYAFVLNEDPENLQYYSEDIYLEKMKNIIHFSRLQISDDTLNRYNKNETQKEYSSKRKKELLLSWWDREITEDKEIRDIFVDLLESEYTESLILLIYITCVSGDSFQTLYEIIKNGEIMGPLRFFRATYCFANSETKKEITDGINEMFNRFDKMEQMKKRLK